VLTPAGRPGSTGGNGQPSRSFSEGWSSITVSRRVFLLGRQACISQHLCSRKRGNLRIRFVHWSFCRICRVLPDAACRRFHATRPKPQLRKPAWLPFYTGGDSSLQLVLSAFIFRLPCGQQRSITPPCESNRPPPSLRDNGRPDCAEALGD